MLFRKELILQSIAKVIQTSKKLVCKRTTSGNEPFTSQSGCNFRFLRIFEFIPLNRNQKIALSCIILLFAFYLAANMLYPWRGDDMGTIAALRIRSPWELIKTTTKALCPVCPVKQKKVFLQEGDWHVLCFTESLLQV